MTNIEALKKHVHAAKLALWNAYDTIEPEDIRSVADRVSFEEIIKKLDRLVDRAKKREEERTQRG